MGTGTKIGIGCLVVVTGLVVMLGIAIISILMRQEETKPESPERAARRAAWEQRRRAEARKLEPYSLGKVTVRWTRYPAAR